MNIIYQDSTNSATMEDWADTTEKLNINSFIDLADETNIYTKTDFEHDLQKSCSPK
jgi:hypothetical protein